MTQGRSRTASGRNQFERSARPACSVWGSTRIDLYQIDWPKLASAPADYDAGRLEDAWQAMNDLRREGKVGYLGASNFDADQLARVHAIAPVTSLQPPYSLLRRDIEHRELPWCREHDVGVIVYSPMQSGLLSGKMTRERIASLPADDWRRNAAWFKEPQLTMALRVVDVLRDIAARHGRQVAEVAIAWTLHHPAVTGAIVGARRADQVDEFVRARDLELQQPELAAIDAALREEGIAQFGARNSSSCRRSFALEEPIEASRSRP